MIKKEGEQISIFEMKEGVIYKGIKDVKYMRLENQFLFENEVGVFKPFHYSGLLRDLFIEVFDSLHYCYEKEYLESINH